MFILFGLDARVLYIKALKFDVCRMLNHLHLSGNNNETEKGRTSPAIHKYRSVDGRFGKLFRCGYR